MSRRAGNSADAALGPLAKALQLFKTEHRLTGMKMGAMVKVSDRAIKLLLKNEEPSISMLRRLARFFSWSTVEFAEALLYEGYRGRKRRA